MCSNSGWNGYDVPSINIGKETSYFNCHSREINRSFRKYKGLQFTFFKIFGNNSLSIIVKEISILNYLNVTRSWMKQIEF